ncbi:uncharacterized protein JCM15063_005015 [Sporobolomyces koalae]|uniref:uncharacterized protein n=1 Tax=Sporobolomyces koalae TaxID=500713 RepID=UPI003175DBF0
MSNKTGPIPLKIVIVGDGGVGKSSITMALLRRDFSEEYDPTVEDSYSTHLSLDGKEYAIELIDTAGQEEYRGLWAETSAREGDGFILTYAIDSQDSFELLPDLLHTLRKARSPIDNPTPAMTPENTPFPFICVANKTDLPPTERTVAAQQGLGFARTAGGLFYEVSAKQRVNIDAFFATLVRAVAHSKLKHEEHVAQCRGKLDDGLFNGNIAFLEKRQQAQQGGGGEGTTGSRASSRVGGVRYGNESDKEKQKALASRGTRNPSLAMDRRRSLSVGGLGGDPDGLGRNDSHAKGCGCIIA